jgi:hypothetical protein
LVLALPDGARQRKDGTWVTLDHVTPDELRALLSGGAST